MTSCRYCVLGCSYRGAARAAAAHEAICAHPRRPAAELMSMLARRQKEHEHSLAHYRDLMDLLSYEKITFNGNRLHNYIDHFDSTGLLLHDTSCIHYIRSISLLSLWYQNIVFESIKDRFGESTDRVPSVCSDLQLRPFRTEELHKLYFETSRFTAFGFQWVVKAFVNKHQRDPTQSTQREITYQVHRNSLYGALTPSTSHKISADLMWLVNQEKYSIKKQMFFLMRAPVEADILI